MSHRFRNCLGILFLLAAFGANAQSTAPGIVNITIPNVFTPNNDQVNDTWYPVFNNLEALTDY
ncbi:MAG TPA: hypothetical protein VGO45_12485 [Bacteroidia bacterium]|jgi:hypothetical protein|nr:hypothetical protein [Bacteroidia bacterium]